MKISKWFAFALAPMMTIALVGCDVDVEESGSLPNVDVTPGSMPEVDVDGPEVTTGTTTVEVPTVDVDVPDDDDDHYGE